MSSSGVQTCDCRLTSSIRCRVRRRTGERADGQSMDTAQYECGHWVHNKCMKEWARMVNAMCVYPTLLEPPLLDIIELPCGCRPPRWLLYRVVKTLMIRIEEWGVEDED